MADFMDDKQIQKYLEEQARLFNQGKISQQEYNNAIKDAQVGIKGYTEQMAASTANLQKSFIGLGKQMVDGAVGAKVYNQTISAASQTAAVWAQKIPVLGDAIGAAIKVGGKYIEAVNKHADSVFQTYQDISRNGLSVGMEDTFKNLQNMGYTMKEVGEMSGVLKRNANIMANFGGTAAAGAKQFSEVAKSIQYSDVGNQLKLMGMNTSDMNEGIANYIRMQQVSGSSKKLTNQQMATAAAEYMVEQDRLTKLTGMNAKAQQQLQEQAMAQQQWAISQYKLKQAADAGDVEAKAKYERNQELLIQIRSKYDEQTANQFMEAASGSLRTEGARAFNRTFPNMMADYKNTLKPASELMVTSSKDAANTLDNVGALASNEMAEGLTTSIGGLVHGVGSLTKNQAAANKDAKAQIKQQTTAPEGVTDSMVEQIQSQRNQTMALDALNDAGVRPVTWAMSKFAKGIEGLTGLAGRVAGREGRVGGGGTWTGGSAPSLPPSAVPQAGPSGAPSAAPSAAPGAAPSAAPGATGTAPVGPTSAAPATSGGASVVSSGAKTVMAGMDAIKQMIIGHEGIRTRPYQDSLGLWTVGVGHLIGNGKSLPADMNREFSKEEVMAMFEEDFAHHYAIAQNTPGWDKANETARGAMIDLAFNMGQWWKKFPNTAKALAAGDWASAAAGLRDSKWASQVKGRAATITSMIEQGGATRSAATGGILSGPMSGYTATLHGNEAVVPLPDGKTIPVQFHGDADSSEQLGLLSAKIGKLDMMIRSMQKQNTMATKILQLQS